MDGSASPRKPSVAMESRSLTSLSLLVAWRSKASRASSRSMPQPSSATRMQAAPAAFDVDAEFGGAGVERVLEQLLDDGGRALHHLAGGDLVGDLSERTRMRPIAITGSADSRSLTGSTIRSPAARRSRAAGSAGCAGS